MSFFSVYIKTNAVQWCLKPIIKPAKQNKTNSRHAAEKKGKGGGRA